MNNRIKVLLAGLFFLFLAGSVFSAELKVYFPFDEGTGTITKDKVGGLAGELHNARWVEGKSGKALYFDGKETGCSYVGVTGSGQNSFLQMFDGQPFSITCWVKIDSAKDYRETQEIMNTASDIGPGWRFRYYWRMVGFLSGDGTKYWSATSNPSLNKVALDDWTHLAVVKNKDGFLSLYLNGKKVAQSEAPFDITSNNSPLTIGAYLNGYAYGFKGIIDEVKIYRGELTPEEIYKETQVGEKKTSLTLDGKLDEPLWQKAQKVSPFYIYNSDNQPAYAQTIVFFTHDDQNLYFAFVCDEPKIAALKKSVTANGMEVYRDDCVEVMVDADNNKADFYHILVNPLGYYGAELNTQSGQVSSPVSNFRCFTGASIEKDRWVVELAIPYSSFVEERIKSEIAFNCARDRRVDLAKTEESSCGQKGQFNQPVLFTAARLTGTDVSPYAFTISYPVVKETTYKDEKIEAKISSRITNLSSAKKELLLSVGEEKMGMLSSLPLSLAPGEEKDITLNFPVPGANTYQINLSAKDKGALVYTGTFPVKITYTPVELDVLRPFYHNNIYATENITQLEVNCKLGLKEEEYKDGKIVLSLNDPAGKEIVSKTFPLFQKKTLLSLPIPQLSEGKYNLVCRVTKGTSLAAEQTAVITKLPPAKGNEVRIDQNLNMVVNGKPMLPIIWWAGGDLKEIAATGGDGIITGFTRDPRPSLNGAKAVNQYVAIMPFDSSAEKSFWDGQSTLSKEAKEYITDVVNFSKDHPATLCYYLSDEPEISARDNRILEESYNLIRELDPYHPILICNDTVWGMHTYKDALDMFFPDPYICPKNDGTLERPMPYVSTFMEEAKKAGSGKKLIGMTPQVFNYGDYGQLNGRVPTFTEERCMQYLAVIHGAKGFNYYVYSGIIKYPDLKVGIPCLIKEIKSLAPVILTGKETAGVKVSSPDIHLLAKEEGNHLYLFACNVTDKPLNIEVTLPLETGEMRVVSEGRSVKAAKKSFTDQFGPYAVHIYTTNTALADVVSLSKIKEAVTGAGGVFEFKYR